MYVEARKDWLNQERKFLEAVGLLIRAPDDYDHEQANLWDLKFGNGEFCINGQLLINEDEVPFTVNWDTRQLCFGNERVSVTPSVWKYIKKYRMGTLLIFTSPLGPVLTVMVFKDGEAGVRQKLKHMKGCTPKVMFTSNAKGTINKFVWKLALQALAMATRDIRGAIKSDFSWKYALVLYVDNHSTHLDKVIAEWARYNFGIFVRCLLRNASHIGQPVDFAIGRTYKTDWKSGVLNLLSNVQMMHNMCIGVAIDRQKWREVCIRMLAETLHKVQLLDFLRLIN